VFRFFPKAFPEDFRSVIKLFVARFGWKPAEIRDMLIDDILLCIDAYNEDAQRQLDALNGVTDG